MDALGRLDSLRRQAPDVRHVAAELLDEISRPMTWLEIEKALRNAGVSRSQRIKLVRALRGLAIIALADSAGNLISGERHDAR